MTNDISVYYRLVGRVDRVCGWLYRWSDRRVLEMNVAEQEALFKQVQRRFPGTSARWQSGYVAGVVDTELERDPCVDSDEEYELGYGLGYLDAVGVDALEKFGVFFANMHLTIGNGSKCRWWEQS